MGGSGDNGCCWFIGTAESWNWCIGNRICVRDVLWRDSNEVSFIYRAYVLSSRLFCSIY